MSEYIVCIKLVHLPYLHFLVLSIFYFWSMHPRWYCLAANTFTFLKLQELCFYDTPMLTRDHRMRHFLLQ